MFFRQVKYRPQFSSHPGIVRDLGFHLTLYTSLSFSLLSWECKEWKGGGGEELISLKTREILLYLSEN